MPYAPQSPFVPSPNGIDPRIVPGVRGDPYPDYPDDWLALPPPAAPRATVPAPPSRPSSANPGIPTRAAPRPDPLAAFWASIPASSLTEFAWNPPIFPDALGQYPHSRPAPPPFDISSFDGVGGLLGGLTKRQPAPGDFPLGLLGGFANLSRAPADPPLGLLGFVPPPPTAPTTPLDPFSGPAWGFSARPPSPLGRLANPAWSPPPAGLGIDGGDPALGRELADSNAATAAYPSGSPSYTQPDSIEYQGGNKGGFLPDSVSETIGDVAKSAGVGVGQGLINSAGFLGDAREFLSGGVQKAADYFAPGSGASAGTFFFKGMPDFVQGAPTSSQLRQQAESVTGPFYQPKTTAGEYARTIGEFAPGALVPGGGLLGNTVRYVVVPALASETAGQFTKGTAAEPWARAAAGLVAAGAGAWWRNLRPGPAAPEIAETLPTRRSAPLEEGAGEEIGGQVPPEQIADPRPKPSALTDPGPAVSEAVPEVGSTASLTVEGGPSRAEQLRAQRAAQLKVNKAAGTAFETTTGAGIDKDVYDYAPQVTIEMPSGAQARLDFMIRNRVTGEIGCLECKSSLTAPMTPNQAKVFSEMEKHTATVVGKGKPGFPGGMKIPPTRVEIRRPRD